jgi:hypothetical protein
MLAIYSTVPLTIFISAGVVLAATGSLYYMRMIAREIQSSFRYVVIWFFGPMFAGLACSLELYFVIVMQQGGLPQLDLHWFLAMQMPGTVATLVAYFLASMFDTPVHAVALKIPVRRM